MGRGRLLFSYLAEIAQLDTLEASFQNKIDNVFRAPTLKSTDDGIGKVERKEKTVINVPCQIEVDSFESLNQMFSGNVPKSDIILTFHFRDLERLGLVEDAEGREGREALKIGDRIVKIKDRFGRGVFEPPFPPGLFIKELRPTGFMERRNLILAFLEDREQGARV